MFIDELNDDTIPLRSLQKVAQELGENMSNEGLKDILENASSNDIDLNIDEFYEILIKKVSIKELFLI